MASGRQLLLMGRDWSTGPIDYADLLQSYNNASKAGAIATTFANQLETDSVEYERHEATALTPIAKPDLPLVSLVNVGEYIAEDELPGLSTYFVETAHSHSLQEGGFKIVVGRKGTGKSALAHTTYERLRGKEKAAVRVITPKGYELKQILEVVKKTNLPMGGPIADALWRYAIATEALAAIWERLEIRTIDAPWSQPEADIREAITTGEFAGLGEFSFASRVAVLARQQYDSIRPDSVAPEADLIGNLRGKQLRRLRDLVCNFLTFEDWQLSILIDDIVPTWQSVEERAAYAELLLSFLAAVRELWREWNDYVNRHNGQPISVLIFLRSDIFGSMLSTAQEQDRIPHDTLQWEDVDSLLALIYRRIEASSPGERLYWSDIFHDDLPYDTLKSFIDSTILYRPRDVIFFFSRVLFYAGRRKADYIERRDLALAAKDYSEYAFKALAAEWCPQIPDVQDLLLSFLGSRSEMDDTDLREKLVQAQVEPADADEAIRFLVDSHFLGMAIDQHNYRYALTPTQGEIMMRQANRFVHDQGGSVRFQVHKAFHHSLAFTLILACEDRCALTNSVSLVNFFCTPVGVVRI